MADVIAKLMRAAEAAEAAARTTLVSPEEERVIIDAAEALAGTRGSDAGVPAKTRAVVLQLETKWLVFLDKHGAEYKWDVRKRAASSTSSGSAQSQSPVRSGSAQCAVARVEVPRTRPNRNLRSCTRVCKDV